MTLHVVLGDGEMAVKELQATLQELKTRAERDDDPFWFLIQAKPEPTATDQAMVKWLTEEDIWFDSIGDGSEVDPLYEGAQNKFEAKRLAPKVVQLMKAAREGDEENPADGADLLTLFVSDDTEAKEDAWLNDVARVVALAEFSVYVLNDGLIEIEMESKQPPEEAVEEEPVPAKTASKKVPAKKAAASNGKKKYTREELEAMERDQLKEVAEGLGIDLPPRTRMHTYIDHILGEAEVADIDVEVEETASPPPAADSGPTTSLGQTWTSATGSANVVPMSLSGPAMVIVVANGTVMSKVISPEEARRILT